MTTSQTGKYLIPAQSGTYELVIGLEIHAQIASNSKLFSRSKIGFGGAQNSQVALLDAGIPGTLPVLNKFCVEQAIKTGLGINATINLRSQFDRKNYFYPDLPAGYQISQFFHPIVSDGEVEITLSDGRIKKVGVERIHLEQDAGKLIHDQDPHLSLIDFNRAGVGLMEIVSRPEMYSPEEAGEYVKKIRGILRALGSSDADMEKGNLRCDANVSVRKEGVEKFGTRCEIKNINSIRNVMRAIEFEAKRQVALIENGGTVSQETRLFDAISGETRTMRSKEDAIDYRYFPDPDLPPLILSQQWIDDIKQKLPELPEHKKKRYIQDYQLTPYDASILVTDQEMADYFEILVAHHSPKLCVTWLTVELLGRMNKLGIGFETLQVSTDHLRKLLDLIVSNTISGKMAKDVLDEMMKGGEDPEQIIEAKGLKQVSDVSALEKIIDEVIAENNSSVLEYRSGKERLFGFFVGAVMKKTAGKANPQIINELLKKKLTITQ